MSTVGFATLDIVPSVKGLAGQLQQQTTGPMAAAGRTGGSQFGTAAGASAGSTFKTKFASGLKGFSPLAAIGGTAALVGVFKNAIGGASGLAESANKINVVFGDAAAEVNKFSDSASESLGQSDLQARNAAASFGIYGKAAGLAGTDLAGFSTGLTSLASDLASFYDTSVEEAIQAIGSGLRGEAEPLRAYGVLLDDASLRQEALKQGLIETTKTALTPQNKVLASNALILAQTKVAQGDFANTSDGLANSSRALAAQYADLETELGKKLLPATQAFVTFLKDDALPALSSVGGFASDVASAFKDLPTPIKQATAAFVGLKIASAVGLSGLAAGAVAGLSSQFLLLRVRVSLASDAFILARANGAGLGAVFAGIGAGATGAAVGLKALSLAIAPIAIVTAAISIFSAYKKGQDEAAAATDGFRSTLEERTAAITADTRAEAANQLEKAGALEAAKKLGISLSDVTDAALGNEDAIKRITARYAELKGQGLTGDQTDELITLGIAVQKTSDALGDGVAEQKRLNEATKETDSSTGSVTRSFQGSTVVVDTYAKSINKAKDALQKLIDKEKTRATNAIQEGRDRISLRSITQIARKEAEDGKRTLEGGTYAGDKNMGALLDLADQWANSVPKVTNAKGAYEDIRRKFIDVAEDMGATEDKAKSLADQLLKVPKNAPVRFQSKGYQERVAEIEHLKELLKSGFSAELQYDSPRSVYAASHPTTPTAPTDPRGVAPRGGVNFNGPINVTANSYDDFIGKVQKKKQRAGLGGRP